VRRRKEPKCCEDSLPSAFGQLTWRRQRSGTRSCSASDPYFERPLGVEPPQYAEWRLGDYQHELGLIDRKYLPAGSATGPGGAVVYWHVDDVAAMFAKLLSMGAKEYQPPTKREAGFITAAACTTRTIWRFCDRAAERDHATGYERRVRARRVLWRSPRVARAIVGLHQHGAEAAWDVSVRPNRLAYLTTTIYTHVLNRGPSAVKSPIDTIFGA
jgi:hypothetical protein